MTKKGTPKPEGASRGPARSWPPVCPGCGARGEPGPEWSPYLACGGDEARHQRTPVGATA